MRNKSGKVQNSKNKSQLNHSGLKIQRFDEKVKNEIF